VSTKSDAEFYRKVDRLLDQNWRKLSARQKWQIYERRFQGYIGTPRWDELPANCQRSLAQAKRAALGLTSLSEVERRALLYWEPLRRFNRRCEMAR